MAVPADVSDPNPRTSVRLTSIKAFRVRYTLTRGAFTMSGGTSASVQDGIVVRLETSDQVVGWGEVCPFSPSYMPAFAEGALAAMSRIGPALLGVDPRLLGVVRRRMDLALMGHVYAKSAIDIACWDVLGKYAGMSVGDLLGGRVRDLIPLYQGVPLAHPGAMAEEAERLRDAGYRSVQIKVGEGQQADAPRIERCLGVLGGIDRIVIDANGGWNVHEARSILAAFDVDGVSFEQPCRTIEACASSRRGSRRPMILDESLDGFAAFDRARSLGALDGANLKLARLGGITPVAQLRDVCVQIDVPMSIEDSGGGDIVSAAVANLMAGVETTRSLSSYLPSSAVDQRLAEGAPLVGDGMASVPIGPGLGIEVDENLLPAPELELNA